ncbi:MAG TPA: hypothetical protein VIV11_26920 [Kofleriaceae bacterium]
MRFVVISALLACSHSTQPATTPAAPAPAPASSAAPAAPAASPGLAPQLFTVEQLRAGNPKGRTIEIRMEADGKPTTIEHWVFTAVDADQATIHAITRDEAGKVISDAVGTSTWAELHKHGQFPAAATTIDDNVSITVPAGTFTTRLYTVKTGEATRRVWFAADLPGPPVQFTTEQGGKVVLRAQMLRAR